MGRRKQNERETKRAASTCQSLDRFLPPKKIANTGVRCDCSELVADTFLASDTLAPAPVQRGTGGEDSDVVDLDMAQPSSDLQRSASAVLPSKQHHLDDAAHCTQHSGGPNCHLMDIGIIFSRATTAAEFSNELKALSTIARSISC